MFKFSASDYCLTSWQQFTCAENHADVPDYKDHRRPSEIRVSSQPYSRTKTPCRYRWIENLFVFPIGAQSVLRTSCGIPVSVSTVTYLCAMLECIDALFWEHHLSSGKQTKDDNRIRRLAIGLMLKECRNNNPLNSCKTQ